MKSIMRWGKAALSKVEEVVAPLNSLPPEKAFERSWCGVVDFYHNVASSDDGDPLSSEETLGRSNIMQHLDRMVHLLREEEANSAATMTEGDVGPCMTVLLQKKIVDNLCALGQADRPPGMMPLVLQTMQQLLEGSRQGLMDHHGQITDPVNKLIESAVNAEGSVNKGRLLHLVQTMFKKIQHKPELMEYLVKRDAQGELTEFPMFSTLVQHINDPDEAGVYARRGALTGISMAERNPSLLRFIAHTTTFCSDVALGIANAYSAVIQLGEQRFQEAEKHGAADYLRDQITFLRALGQCEPEEAVALCLTRELESMFVEPILCKSFKESTEDNRAFVLDMCRALLAQLGPSSMRTRIVNLLMDTVELGGMIIGWMSTDDVVVQQSTMQLLANILSTKDETVIAKLVECTPTHEGPADCGVLQHILTQHLNLEGDFEGTEKALKDYREEAEAQLYLWEVYNHQDSGLPTDPEHTFVATVLSQLLRLLDLDLNVAVILTGIVSTLAQCPDPILHRHLLAGGEEAPLTATVIQVCQSVQILKEQTPDSELILEEARRTLDDPAANMNTQEVVVKQFMNVVVWQEFVKELLASLELKNLVFALQLTEE